MNEQGSSAPRRKGIPRRVQLVIFGFIFGVIGLWQVIFRNPDEITGNSPWEVRTASANAAMNSGDFIKADEELTAALIHARRYGDMSRPVSVVLKQLGVLRLHQQRWQEADDLLQQSLIKFESQRATDIDIAEVLGDLAAAQVRLEHPREALADMERAVRMIDGPHRLPNPLTVQILREESAILLLNGEPARAAMAASRANELESPVKRAAASKPMQ
jgi:tetratricopeptide (TPR) repeat protein